MALQQRNGVFYAVRSDVISRALVFAVNELVGDSISELAR
jgi:hypothetical protein